MVPARDTAAGVAAGAGTSGETVFRRGAGAGGAARVDPLLRRIRGLTRFDREEKNRTLDWPGTGLFLLDQEPTLGGGVAGAHGRPRS